MIFTREILDEIKESITPANILSLLEEMGGSPRYYNQNIIISRTLCHNGDSHKLYYYINSKSFYCYTNCGNFDIFGLVGKLFNLDFLQSVYYILNKFNLSYFEQETIQENSYDTTRRAEEDYFKRHKQLTEEIKTFNSQHIELKNFNEDILDRFMYPIIRPWERENISRSIIETAKIGYYPGGGQITIPHYDKNNRLVGIRGRQLGEEEVKLFGKYRPLYINSISYAHPLGFNLYNLNNSKENIAKLGKAIVFEGEKSVLKYRSFFTPENDISVACCGSNISNYQIQLLLESGAKEICIAFDRQFQAIGDDDFKKLTASLVKLHKKYKQIVTLSFIFDKELITNFKDAPVDAGPDVFLQLFKDRIIL